MKQVLIRKGEVMVEEIPAPLGSEDSVLVEVKYSLISVGTEISGLAASGGSLLQKALKQPEKAVDGLSGKPATCSTYFSQILG